MAHILACKYGYHLPLYRQSQMFENEGIELSGSLLASWVGKSTKLLERVSDAIRDHVFAAQAIFMDDTSAPRPLRPGTSSPPVGVRSTPANIYKPMRVLPMRMPMQVTMTPIGQDG